ncbi:MAG: hypothetical protein IIB02_07990 [Thaumarchaeota archaeon]|nr:hypothetical protein [Nitrososphaerota archaeon]
MGTKSLQNKAWILLLGILILPMPLVFAEPIEEKFTRFDGKEIQNNLNAQHILKQIELSKKILKELQEGKTVISEHEKVIDEQRKIAEQYLQEKLGKMTKKYEEYASRKAFSNFLIGVNLIHHDIYWGQFNYVEKKIHDTHAIVEKFVDDGGSRHDAHLLYIKLVSMPKEELVKVVNDLNVKYGFADATTQKYFDKYGKLPRYENDDSSCYGCNENKLRVDIFE